MNDALVSGILFLYTFLLGNEIGAHTFNLPLSAVPIFILILFTLMGNSLGMRLYLKKNELTEEH